METAREYMFTDIAEGLECEHAYRFTNAVYDALVSAFNDRSPIHVDEDYARQCGFSGPVMHGAILHGFLSHFVGMHLPGRRALLQSVNLRYHKPSYIEDELVLKAVVRQKVESARTLVMDIRFVNSAGVEVATGRVQVGVRGDE